MLSGEGFSDQPRTVCPVIAGFLWAYNDILDDERRQDLYPVASAVVGTVTSDEDVIAMRAHLIAEWGREQLGRRRRRFLVGQRSAWLDESHGRDIGVLVVRTVRRIDDVAHASALALIAELIASGPRTSPACTACGAPDGAPVTLRT
jgi:hypothetical protein